MKPMVETKHDLLTTKYTQVLEEKEYQFNAPHTFEVVRKLDANTEFNPETDLLAKIHFQEGPIKECGVNGVCKLLFADDDTLLGAHVLGNPASEIITLAGMAIELKLKRKDWKKIVFPHPTVGEIFREAL